MNDFLEEIENIEEAIERLIADIDFRDRVMSKLPSQAQEIIMNLILIIEKAAEQNKEDKLNKNKEN